MPDGGSSGRGSGEDSVGSYSDGRIACSPEALLIHGYPIPRGTKRIPYGEIRGVRRVSMGAFTGRSRIWGSANPRYWANYDPRRPRKGAAFIIDTGHAIRPFITPDDPDAFESALSRRCPAPVRRTGRGVVI